jgi:hypothetical protein
MFLSLNDVNFVLTGRSSTSADALDDHVKLAAEPGDARDLLRNSLSHTHSNRCAV